MGLDSVELVMAYEEAFKIEISDAEAEKILTPAGVIALVMQKHASRWNQEAVRKVCLSQVSFYRLRRAFCEELGLPRNTLRPDTELAPLLPRNRAARWEALKLRAGLTCWPSLVVPGWLWFLSFLIGPIVYIAWWFGTGTEDRVSAAGVIFSVLVGIFVTLFITRPLHSVLPLRTLGDLAKEVGSYQFATLMGEHLPSREQIAAAVREITIAQLGLKPEEYREDAEFVRDFGMG